MVRKSLPDETSQSRKVLLSILEDQKITLEELKKSQEQLSKKNIELASINSLSRKVSQTLSIQEVISSSIKGLTETVKADVYFILLREEEKLILKGIDSEDSKNLLGEFPEYKVGECICGLAVEKKTPLYSKNIFNDKRCTWDECKKAGLKSFAALPLFNGDDVIGIVGLSSKEEYDFKHEANFLETLSKTISIGLSNALLFTKTIEIEQSLKESEKRFRTLFNTSYEGICVSDFDNKISFVNPRMAELTGYSVDELSMMNFKSLLPTEELKDHEEKGDNRKKGKFEIYERKLLRKDGSTIWTLVSASPAYDKNGNYNGSFGMFTDISKLKATTNEFRKFYLGVEQNPTIVMITYLDGKIEYVNPRFSEVTGYTLEEVVGKNPNILKSGFKPSAEYKELWDTILSGKSWRGEFLNKKKNGELFWESAVISPIVDDHGNIFNFIAIKQDITERKKMIEEIIFEKEKALASERIKTEFLSQMSHEVRTPINIITGNVSILKAELSDKLDEGLLEIFQGIELSSRRIIRTIDLILNITELQTGAFHPIYKAIDLKTYILPQLIQEFQFMAQSRNLDLRLNMNATVTIVFADEYCVTQIFSNLIDNALKYTKHGKVEVILENKAADDIVVKVMDTGIGISDEFMDHLFEPFTQEEHGYTRSYDGNGLGLALVKKYCDINNATIEVETAKNEGTTFSVIFKKTKR